MSKEVAYEDWKKAAYEAWRAFLPAFLGVVYVQLQVGAGEVRDVWMWARSVLVAAAVAGAKAVMKWAREKWGNQEYDKLIYKLPL